METQSEATSGNDAPVAATEEDPRDALRAGLHAMWASVAPGWGANAEFIDRRGSAVTGRMIELTAPASGESVLELACGPGSVGLAAAERVAPDGTVVVSDVAAEMVAIAAARAEERGLSNISSRVLDLERIDEPDGLYDVVLCREGLMLVPDPERAAREIARVLAPGGRFAVAVWGPRERNPWLGFIFDAVSAELGNPVPPPGIPGPFSLEDRDRFAALLADAGLAEVTVNEVSVPLRAPSADVWLERASAMAGPLANVLASLPDEAKASIRERATTAAAPFEGPEGLDLPGVTLLASGRAGA